MASVFSFVAFIFAMMKFVPLLIGYQTSKVSLFALKTNGEISAGEKLDQALFPHMDRNGLSDLFRQSLLRTGEIFDLKKTLHLDRCEVSQSEFARFAQWQAQFSGKPFASPAEPENHRYHSNTKNHAVSGKLTAATNGVSWFEAYAYCAATGGKLPTRKEWLAAALGEDGRLYPWGDSFFGDGFPYIDPVLNAAQKCGVHDSIATPEGIQDLGTNVSEWTGEYIHQAYLMGGNGFSRPAELHSLSLLYRKVHPDFRSQFAGFRCAYSDAPAPETPWGTTIETEEIPPALYPTGIPEDARVPALIVSLPPKSLADVQQIFLGPDSEETRILYFSTNEITVREYTRFLRDPFVILGLYAEDNQPRNHTYYPPNWENQTSNPDLPVTNIDWWSAYSFAWWAGGRLPTAQEWIAASSTKGQNLYPWGNAFAFDKTNTGERGLNSPIPASELFLDVTKEGIIAMGGNVSEWTKTLSPEKGKIAFSVKGGNYLLPGKSTARFDYTNRVPPDYRSPSIGFRVVFERDR